MKPLVILLFVGLFLTLGCSEDSNDSGPTGVSNNAPVIRSISSNPVNVGRQQYAQITCVATDSDGDSLTYFWRATSGSIGSHSVHAAIVNWCAPNTDGNYWVGVTVSDGREVDADSLELTVSAPNGPPAVPWDPIPRDGSPNIDRPVTLTWKCSDIDGDPILYDLNFGTNHSTISVIQRDLDTASYVLSNLNSDVWYYWQVVARDDHGNTVYGPIWSFWTR